MIKWLHILTPYLTPWRGMHRWILFFKLKLILLKHLTWDVARFGEWVWAWKLSGSEIRFGEWVWAWKLKGWEIRFSLESGLRRERKNEKREKKERKGKPTRKEKGRKEKGRKENTCVLVSRRRRREKTKREDEGRRRSSQS